MVTWAHVDNDASWSRWVVNIFIADTISSVSLTFTSKPFSSSVTTDEMEPTLVTTDPVITAIQSVSCYSMIPKRRLVALSNTSVSFRNSMTRSLSSSVKQPFTRPPLSTIFSLEISKISEQSNQLS